jgi:aryl-alcohol dehydrogenase-like predicted oxidoreductase
VSVLPESVLGRTGVSTSRLGYGSMELRHTGAPARPHLDRASAGALLQTALDSGISYIDTSPTYGPAEELIGEFLAHRRSEFTLATKTGFVVEELPARRHVFMPEVIRRGIEWSLGRLRTDYVDVLQLPGSPTMHELEEFGALDELELIRDAGLCRFIGISGWTPHLGEHVGTGRVDVFQIPYSALERDNEEVISVAAGAGIGTVIRGGLAQGRTALSRERADELGAAETITDSRERWRGAIEGFDADATAMLLRYTMSHPGVNTVIVGTSDPAHLRANLAAAALGPLSDIARDAIRARLDDR